MSEPIDITTSGGNNLRVKPEAIAERVAMLRAYLPMLTNEQRIDVFSEVAAGYCRHCGIDLRLTESGVCHCNNDE